MKKLFQLFLIILLAVPITSVAVSNSDTMLINMIESMNSFVDNPYNTRAFVRNVVDDNSSVRTTLTFGDEKYYGDGRYVRSLFINTVAFTEATKGKWKPSVQDARDRVSDLVMKLYDYSAGSSADDGPMPVDSGAFRRILNSDWEVDGFFSGYMSGTTRTTGGTYTWEIFPFYILLDDEVIRNGELFVYFRLLNPGDNGSSDQVYEYIVGDYSEVNYLLSQLMKLNKNLSGWDKELMQDLVR